ncbi:MAG: HAMP domain-containing sensor histidine kinase [Archangium sp.]|nr:HAMP domain-containing sensor histidine kinase [Archangium sp.]MDP3575969.1 HAMP domain-containing sensor histidine kinase [Archangium sp.]
MSISQMRLMVARLSAGAAQAVHHYSNARDEEARKQAARHSAFLAHELRNPLQSAILAFTVLRNQAAPNEKATAVAARSLARLRDLIDHSLAEVRLHAELGVAPEWILVARFLEEIRDESNVEAEEKQITVSVESAPHTRIEADPRLLRSAMSNLLRNAIKFSHRHSRVVVRATSSAGRISFEVEDACGGLPPGQVEKIFDPFVQLGTDRSGFGLGLAIVKQVSESHGGSLRVNNLPGKGCVFMLDIPERAQPSPRSSSSARELP